MLLFSMIDDASYWFDVSASYWFLSFFFLMNIWVHIKSYQTSAFFRSYA